jgi:hypothetical protein
LEKIHGILSDDENLHSHDPDGAAFAVEHWGTLLEEVQAGTHDRLPFYVKKPECPARKSGDEWPSGFTSDSQQVRAAFSIEEAPYGSTGFFT